MAATWHGFRKEACWLADGGLIGENAGPTGPDRVAAEHLA
jgi:hypothetical protein